jgi:uncharacterized protein
MSWHQWQGDTLELKLYIQPGAHRTQVMGLYLDRLKVRIAAPPVEDKANKALLGFLADQFGVARSKVRLFKWRRAAGKVGGYSLACGKT